MDWDRLITIEQMEEATNTLLETGKKVGADSWQQRVKNQTPHCGFGEAGTCCRICSMGPCRITPKAPRGICGCDVHGIVGRNYLRFTAGGAATHSDHGRQICHTLYQAKEGGSYQVKDPEKLKKIAAEWGIETEGKDIYDLAHEVAETGLLESSKPGYASVTFTTTVEAEKADGGVKIGERVYSVGDEIDMRAGSSRLTVFVRSIDAQ